MTLIKELKVEKDLKIIYLKFISDLDSSLSLMKELLNKRSVANSVEDDFKKLVKGCKLARDNFIYDYKALIEKYKKDDTVIDMMSMRADIKELETKLKAKIEEMKNLTHKIEDRYGNLDVYAQMEFSDFIMAGNLDYNNILTECKIAIRSNKKDPRTEARLKIKAKIKEAEASLQVDRTLDIEKHILKALKKVTNIH
jgi:hypothetical protein